MRINALPSGNGFNFEISHAPEKSLARAGTISTPHGDIATPAFIPVGTTALRALESLYWSGVWLIEKKPLENETLIIPKEYAYEVRDKSISIKDSLEAVLAYLKANKLEHWLAETEILIMPGYKLHFCDALITNFHQPKSTLLVLIAALIGDDWKKVYEAALEKIRF